jgi:hypothetical protein
MIRLYQNQMSDSFYSYVNEHGHVAAAQEFPEYAIKMNIGTHGKKVSYEEFIHYYKCVAEIDANDLEDAFRIGNIGPAEKMISVPGERSYSMSVGDVCKLDGTFYQVMDFGFEEIL